MRVREGGREGGRERKIAVHAYQWRVREIGFHTVLKVCRALRKCVLLC